MNTGDAFWRDREEQEARIARGEKSLCRTRSVKLDGDREVTLGRITNHDGGWFLSFRARDEVVKFSLSDEAYAALRMLMDVFDDDDAEPMWCVVDEDAAQP